MIGMNSIVDDDTWNVVVVGERAKSVVFWTTTSLKSVVGVVARTAPSCDHYSDKDDCRWRT